MFTADVPTLRRMETWEYKVVLLNGSVWKTRPGWGEVLTVEQLNEYGGLGWDVAASWQVEDAGYPVLLLKRRTPPVVEPAPTSAPEVAPTQELLG